MSQLSTHPASTLPVATLSPAILETVLTRLAPLFLTSVADLPAARDAASRMLDAYHPRTDDELRLAAAIIGFSFHALEALGQAAARDIPLNRVLRLRGGAVSLNREAVKAERRLGQLQNARRQAPAAQPARLEQEAVQVPPRAEKSLAVVEDTRATIAAAKAKGMTWTQAHEQRQRDIRMAASLKKAEALAAAPPRAPPPNPAQDHRPLAQAI